MIIVAILSAIGWFIPPQWHAIILVLFGFLSYMQGYFPFYPDPSLDNTFGGLARSIGIMTIVGWTITFFIAQYGVRILVKWMPLPHFVRFGAGTDLNLDGPPLDLRPADRGAGRVVDLRRGPKTTFRKWEKGKKGTWIHMPYRQKRTMRDIH